MSHYYVQGLGYISIDPKHLPRELYVMNKIDLLDLWIFKFDDNTWIQKNYISEKIRIIIKTNEIKDKEEMEKETNLFLHEEIEKVFKHADTILQKQDEIKMLFCVA